MIASPPDVASPLEQRVLVLVRGEKDARLTQRILDTRGFFPSRCATMTDLCDAVREGAGAAVVAEEVLSREAVGELASLLARQPAWSDFPLLIISSESRALGDALGVLGNVTFLDRPVHVRTILAAVDAAVRSRRRQYDARRAIESRDTFLAMLGHELRNPLAAIRLAVGALERRPLGDPRPRELDVVERQSRQLGRMVDDLLDVARVTHGKIALHRHPLNLCDVVRSAFETQEARAREQGLAYELTVAEPDLRVEGDRERLDQAFANLLSNALKYTPAGGSVRVWVGAERGAAVVTVTDTGVGLAPEMLGRVFDVFAQADTSLDRAQGGIGLGLALVRAMLQLHHGSVEAESAGVGKGCLFRVRLPRVVAAAAEADAAASSHPSADGAARRVVVVDDNPDIRELLSDFLVDAGHQVTVADDGPTGLERLLEVRPDIAFVDLGLPGFDGLELARRARACGSAAHLVALTGYGQAQDRDRAFRAGFDEHLTKPVAPADIEGSLRRAPAALHG